MMDKVVIKRDGSTQPYDENKIVNALNAAFKSCGYKELPEDIKIYALFMTENLNSPTVEDIQNTVEDAIMHKGYYNVARAYIKYRAERKAERVAAEKKWEFIENFVNASTTADATIDDNSNVNNHNIAVLNAEIHKEDNIHTNMYIWERFLRENYPELPVKQMRKDFKTILYPHDSSSQVMMPYCKAITMYPFLTDGLKKVGGKSAVPKSLESFVGIYINLIYEQSSEVKGAVATPEVLFYMDYFARREWGEEYYLHLDKLATGPLNLKPRTIRKQIHQYFQQMVYSINQVSSARGAQCPFTNFSFFDKYFFEGMFGDFRFPDGTGPKWEPYNWLQQEFLHWLNQERLKCINTFPVCSYACLTKDGEYVDEDTFEFISKEYSEGNSFFLYTSDSVDSLSSCCRLRNAISKNTFNTTNGQMGVMTGSKNVITLDLNRIVQDWYKTVRFRTYDKSTPIGECINELLGVKTTTIEYSPIFDEIDKESLKNYLVNILERVYKYHTAYNKMLHWAYDHNLFNDYKAGFISLDKQYLTIGISGLNQAAEFLGIKCNNNKEYQEFCSLIYSTLNEQNAAHKTKTEMFNTEMVPAESAAVKLYNRDKSDGYWVPEDTNLYASYVFKANNTDISVLDKIRLHSKEFGIDNLDGGSACHVNLEEHPDLGSIEKLLKFVAKVGCNYFTINVPNCECEDCGFIAKQPFTVCPNCGSTNVSLWDRIIGYLTKVKHWSKARREEFFKYRYRHKKDEIC